MFNTAIQVRSEDTGINHFSSLKETFKYANEDKTVWKISFDSAGGERVRLVRHNENWHYESMTDSVKEVLGLDYL